MIIEKHGGEVPQSFEDLEAMPAVGHKTASVVMSQAFGVPAFPVDTHIHRLAYRWKLSTGKNVDKTEKDLKAINLTIANLGQRLMADQLNRNIATPILLGFYELDLSCCRSTLRATLRPARCIALSTARLSVACVSLMTISSILARNSCRVHCLSTPPLGPLTSARLM